MSTMIYVAGPLGTKDPFSNVGRSIKYADLLRKAGYVPHVPHLYAFWAAVCPGVTYAEWMRLDYAVLERCDVLVRLPGESPGADLEVAHAKQHGIPVLLAEYLDDPSDHARIFTLLRSMPADRALLAEREACALIVGTVAASCVDDGAAQDFEEIAATIRARGTARGTPNDAGVCEECVQRQHLRCASPKSCSCAIDVHGLRPGKLAVSHPCDDGLRLPNSWKIR